MILTGFRESEINGSMLFLLRGICRRRYLPSRSENGSSMIDDQNPRVGIRLNESMGCGSYNFVGN